VTALVIIAEADVLLYACLHDEVMKDLLTQETFQAVALSIARTTSIKMVELGEEEKAISHDGLIRWRNAHQQQPLTVVNSSINAITNKLSVKLVNVVNEQSKFFSRAEGENGAPRFLSYPEDLPKTTYLPFSERTFTNKVLFVLYKMLRAIYVPWFYFMPSCFFFGQYFVPFYRN